MTRGTDPLSPGESIVATEACLASAVDDEQVILDTDTGTYYGLNPVGSYLWTLLEEAHTVEELVSKTATEFDVSKGECRTDVRSFLAEMHEAGLVESA